MRILLTLALAALPACAQAAQFGQTGDILSIEGHITFGDAAALNRAIEQADAAGHPVRTIRLNSPGGIVGEGMTMARTIRQDGLDTSVLSGGICASACFMLFAAGHAKAVEPYGRVGVHSASQTYGMGADDDVATSRMAALVQSFGVPALVTDRMTIETNAGMAWLSVGELQAMGATVALATIDNTWSLPGTGPDDEAQRRNYSLEEAERLSGSAARATDQEQATASFKSNPLYHAITGK